MIFQKTIKLLVAFLALLVIAACSASLTKGGGRVKYVTKQEAPSHCSEIGEVDLSGFGSGRSVGDAKVRMRNKTAEKGGNFLVIDTIEKTCGKNGCLYQSSGRAYKCVGG